AIRAAFADVAKKAKSGDVLVAYFSGHGLSYGTAETGQFYYLTKDIGSEDLSDPEIRNKYTISSSELTEWLTAIPAQKQVMILDACNSGKVVESLAAIGQKDLNSSQIRALDRMKDRTGMFILTGSAADKVSYEASKYGQGLLTYSLLQGMSGLALTPDKRVDVMTLFQYARDEVPNMAKDIGGIQTPVLAFPANGGSFDIGIVNEQVHIPLAQVKPIFIRNNFQDEAAFADVLGLTDVLEKYFREITVKGAQADLIYVDVKEYEGAYSIKGRYTVDGNAVQLRGRLFKGLSPQGEEFQISGKKDNLPALAEAIIASVSALLNQ
ncbi:MAG: caspase family protein, partial [Lewinellaceae bacterium]|nr:caspase family protein [Lewinellaceae bacterium]